MASREPTFDPGGQIVRSNAAIAASRMLALRARERIERSHQLLRSHQYAFQGLDPGLKDEQWQRASEELEAETEQRLIEHEASLTARALRDEASLL